MTSHDSTSPDPTLPTPRPEGDVLSTTTAAHADATPASYPAGSYAPAAHQQPQQHSLAGRAPVGNIRGTGVCILLALVTFGFYTIYYFYKVHQEMKEHSGSGIGGGLAAVLSLFVGIVMPFLTSSEIGNLYRRAGMSQPVSGATGLWYFPGMFILIGPLVWFAKTNSAINNYWRQLGAS